MTKILFIHHGRGLGGASISLLNILENLDRTRFSPSVLLIHDSNFRIELELREIPTFVAKSLFYQKFYRCYTHSIAILDEWYRLDLWLRSSLSWLLSWLYFARQEIKHLNFDIIHLNSSVLTDWLYSCKAKKSNKVIIHIREPFSFGYLKLRYNFFRFQMKKYADAIIAISKDNADRINIPGKTFVVYNFVNSIIKNQNFEIEPIKGSVLYLGGDNAIKGFFDVVNALDYLDPGIFIVFCGNFTNFDKRINGKFKLKNILWKIPSVNRRLIEAHLKIRNHPNAKIVGFMNNPINLFLQSEFLISPFSKPHFSRPIIEAFALNRTAIGSSVEGMDEIIEHGINGLLTPSGSPKLLAESINGLINNSEMKKSLALNGFLKAKDLYGPDNIKSIEEIYIRLLEN